MTDNSYVGIDLGTSYIKGSVLDENGNHVVTVKTRAPAIVSSKPGWTEVDPLEYNFVFKRFLRKLLRKIYTKKVYLGLSSMAPIFIPVDKECYPLYNGILYNDTRAEEEIKELNELYGDLFFEENGNPVNNQQWLPKILWFKKNYPELFSKTWKFMELPTFILCKMTGKIVTDKTMLQEEGLLNYRKRVISNKILEALKIDESYLPEPMELNETLEPFRIDDIVFESNAGTVDFIGSSVSLGMLRPRKMAIIIGSTGVISYSVTDPKPDNRLYLDLGPYNGLYYINGATASAGIFLDYIMELFGMKNMYKKVDKILQNPYINTEGLVLLPYLIGERTPILDPLAKSVIFGLRNTTKKPEILKASIEAIAFSIRHHYDILKSHGYEVDTMYATGGVLKMKAMQTVLPTVMNKRMIKVEEGEESIGDAKIAMVASGKLTWDELGEILEREMAGELLEPSEIKYLEKNYRIYIQLYQQLKELFRI
jgi:Sugar (pentulose and hexulose) kinases